MCVGKSALFGIDAQGASERFDLGVVSAVASSARGQAIATSGGALLRQDPDGGFVTLCADADTLRDPVSAGVNAWAIAKTELALVDARGKPWKSKGLALGADAHLFGSPSGDVWVTGDAGLRRFAYDDPTLPADERDWNTRIAPIYARVCSQCHERGGSAGVDLSSSQTWAAEREKICDRVVSTGDMPPAGTVLSGTDKATIASWCTPAP
jgi:hypothetical protein